MKKIGLIILFCICCAFCSNSPTKVFAKDLNDLKNNIGTYDSCLDNSKTPIINNGSYPYYYEKANGEIIEFTITGMRVSENEGITWMCATKAIEGGNVCSLWLSDDVKRSAEIKINTNLFSGKEQNSLSNTISPVTLVGTCTNVGSYAVNIEVEEGSKFLKIKQGQKLMRGGYYGIRGTTIQDPYGLKLKEFFDDSGTKSKVKSDGSTEYTNSVIIKRCFGGQYGTDNGSCSKQRIPITVIVDNTYFSQSNVAIRELDDASSDYKTTKIVNKSASVTGIKNGVKVGDTVKLIFSHNIYSANEAENDWDLVKSNIGDSSGYKVVSSNVCESPENASFTDRSEVLYAPAERKCDDGSWPYIARDVFEVKFEKVGTYTFCQTVKIGEAEMTKSCAKVAVGEGDDGADPGECANINWFKPVLGVTSVASAIKNNNVASFSSWQQGPIYAKPNDNIEWLHCYYSGVQNKAYDLVSSDSHHTHSETDEAGAYPQDNISVSDFVTPWQNQYTILPSNNFSPKNAPKTIGGEADGLSTGKVTTKYFNDEYGVQTEYNSKAGKSLLETITSGKPSQINLANPENKTWRCDSYDCNPHSCECDENGQNCKTCYDTCWRSCHHGSGPWIELLDSKGPVSSSAEVKVPYNFVNTANVRLLKEGGVVYAGEKANINNLTVTINPKYNNVTDGNYATKVDNATVKVVGYVSETNGGSANNNYPNDDFCSYLPHKYGKCADLNSENTNLNDPEDINGKTDEIGSLMESYNIFDVPAGNYFCVVAAVYPANSGEDTMMDPSGSNSWYISEPSCAQIAKKPSLQVWGAGMYTAGKVKVNNAVKNVVAGVLNDFDPTAKDQITFGTWVEQNIIANGPVNLASGAATGNPGNTKRTHKDVSGSYRNGGDICIISPLTMPNASCFSSQSSGSSADGVGNITGARSVNPPKDKEALIKRFTTNTENKDIVLNNDKNNNQSNTSVCSTGYMDIITKGIEEGETYVYVCRNDDNFAINDDIIYFNDSSYYKLTDIPKVIIYAENIKIACSVTQIDAVLIAENEVDTCWDKDASAEVNSKKASNQLKVNGVIIANKLMANRTYGGATGSDGSGVPAEIVNYDTSLYLWGSPRADVSGSGKLVTTYKTELAPRR